MKPVAIARWAGVSGVMALAMLADIPVLDGQAVQSQTLPTIQSLSEPGERLVVQSMAPDTGFVTFASAPARGLLLPVDPAASAEARAISFVDAYGAAFGLADSSQVGLTRVDGIDDLGVEHVRLQQVHRGVPVRGGELVVHLRGARAVAANGHVTRDLPDDTTPDIAADVAQGTARTLVERGLPDVAATAQYAAPRLEVLNRALLSEPSAFGSRLAWFVQARGFALNQYIWIDAESGAVLLTFSQLPHAKSRLVYTAGNSFTLPGTLVRVEGGPATGDADSDNAYSFAGATYDYFFNTHGRDSYDNMGSILVSTTHYCPSSVCPNDYANAFWNGAQMVYGNGYASGDDVVGHELTHAVTEYSADLLYYQQSGALNESFSDIFGETVDLLHGAGNDGAGVRWLMGEDLPIGAIRNMMSPGAFGDPARMAEYVCFTNGWTSSNQDSGGVHINSGIPNHAYALMVDGGSYNGRTVTGIGLDKAARIQYRALTVYLTSGSNFLDNYNAVNQSCTDLTGSHGISSSDCTQVTTAMLAVEMNAAPPCAGAAQTPSLCTTGSPTTQSLETFEAGLGNWTPSTARWGRTTGLARGGIWALYGFDPNVSSDHQATMTASITVPAGGRLYFDHAFEFDNDSFGRYDGGVIEYSTDGITWTDAASLIDGGQAYNGTLETGFGNPIQGRQAFSAASYGYTGTRLNLAPLAGQNVQFRFRIGTDTVISSLGWLIDNVTFYTCGSTSPPVIDTHPQNQTTSTGGAVMLSVAASGGTLSYQWYAGATGSTVAPIGGATSSSYTTPPLTGNRRFWVRVSNSGGSADSTTALITVTFTDTPLVAGITPIRLMHVSELRLRIDGVRVARGLSLFSWTDPVLVQQVSMARAVHLSEMRTALSQAYVAAGQSAPVFTDPVLAGGVTPIRMVHLNELRAAVMALE